MTNLTIKNNEQATLISHLVELKTRLIRSLMAIAAGSLVGLIFCREIFDALKKPMMATLPEGSFFVSSAPFESYAIYLKVALLTGTFMATPYLFFQFWNFLSPGLKAREKKLLVPFALLSSLLFIGGAFFGYFVVFPTGFYYINAVLDGTGIRLLPNMGSYFSVATMLLLTFGLSFELPLIIFLLGKIGLIDYAFIKNNRRYVIVILFIAAAVLTPGPDILSQCLLALPLWMLFELGGLSLRFMKK
jgi:sec-independent protein translocase protein TatC